MTASLEREEAGSKQGKSESTTHLSHLKITLPLDGTQLKMEMQQLLRSSRPPHNLGESTIRLQYLDEIKKLE